MAEKKKAAAPAAAVATDKKKALETALAQIEKNYGKGAIMRLGDDIAVNVAAIPTGSLSLDLALGIGGTWVGSLTAMEPYRPIFIGLTLLFLGQAFRRLYLVPPSCALGASCADPLTLRRQRLTFWLVAVLLAGLIAVPWLAPLFY